MIARGTLRSAAFLGSLIALVSASVLLALLAADLIRSERRVGAADLAFTSGANQQASWSADTLLPGGLARRVLGIRDDLEFRLAVQRFWLSGPREPLREFGDVTRRSGAERELARVADEDGNSARRAIVRTMRGALLLEEARNTPTQREVFVRRAIEEFHKALILDPSNANALYDLELGLKLLRRSGSGSGEEGERGSAVPSPGAGGATSGSGF